MKRSNYKWLPHPDISILFSLPKGVILPAEGSAPSWAGPHSLTSQPGKDGLRFPAPASIKVQPSCHPPSAPDLCPSSLRSKRVTLRPITRSRVTGTKQGSSSGTPCWLERRAFPLAILPLPLKASCWRPVSCPAALAPPPPPLLSWGWRRISALLKHPAPLKLQWISRRS